MDSKSEHSQNNSEYHYPGTTHDAISFCRTTKLTKPPPSPLPYSDRNGGFGGACLFCFLLCSSLVHRQFDRSRFDKLHRIVVDTEACRTTHLEPRTWHSRVTGSSVVAFAGLEYDVTRLNRLSLLPGDAHPFWRLARIVEGPFQTDGIQPSALWRREHTHRLVGLVLYLNGESLLCKCKFGDSTP